MIDALISSPWPGLVVWAGLFVSDSTLTIACARMYQAGVRDRIRFEGSYEITPAHQADVDALRRFSPRFLLALALTCALQVCLWYLTVGLGLFRETYEVALGGLILSQLTIHVRHLRNYFLFRRVLAGDGVSGRIDYGRATMLQQSAVELGAFAVLHAAVAAIAASWFVFGGAASCASLAVSHWLLARKQEPATRISTQPPDRVAQRAAPGGDAR